MSREPAPAPAQPLRIGINPGETRTVTDHDGRRFEVGLSAHSGPRGRRQVTLRPLPTVFSSRTASTH